MKISNFKKLLTSLLLLSGACNAIASTVQNKEVVNWDNFFIGHSWLKSTSGVLYFENDLKSNPFKMCQDIKNEPWRLTMVDQESKEISRIKDKYLPAYKDIKNITPIEFKNKVGASLYNLKKYCVKVNLAPVVDKGSRGYGNDYKTIQLYSKIYANEMRRHGIVPTWKHFPGMGNNVSVYNNENYKNWYKNIYGEGVIESITNKEMFNNTNLFKNNNSDILMFSVAIFKNISEKPIIFSEEVWNVAYKTQPNSLYIPDDLSELNLTEEQIIWLFKKFDLLMFTSPKDILWVKNILQQAYLDGIITKNELNIKFDRQNNWRKKNNLHILIKK